MTETIEIRNMLMVDYSEFLGIGIGYGLLISLTVGLIALGISYCIQLFKS